MSKAVVLVFGGADSFGARVAELARDKGNTVVLAAPTGAKHHLINTIPNDLSHESISAAFQSTLSAYGHIDAVLIAFVPQPTLGSIPGGDQTAIRDVLDPTVRVVKCALHYARRFSGDKTLAFLAVTGPDIMAQVVAGSIVGLFRSMMARFGAQNTHLALVHTHVADHTAAEALVNCISPDDTPPLPEVGTSAIHLPKRFNAKMHIVNDGVVTTTNPMQGCPPGFQYTDIFRRFSRLVMLDEDAARWVATGGRARLLTFVALLGLAALVGYFFGAVENVKAFLG